MWSARTSQKTPSSRRMVPGQLFHQASSQRSKLKSSQGLACVATANFSINYQADFGDQLYLVGDCEQLGNWCPAAAPKLKWTPGNIWQASIALKPELQAQYKVVRVSSGGHVTWEPQSKNRMLDMPRLLASPASPSEAEFQLTWGQNSPDTTATASSAMASDSSAPDAAAQDASGPTEETASGALPAATSFDDAAASCQRAKAAYHEIMQIVAMQPSDPNPAVMLFHGDVKHTPSRTPPGHANPINPSPPTATIIPRDGRSCLTFKHMDAMDSTQIASADASPSLATAARDTIESFATVSSSMTELVADLEALDMVPGEVSSAVDQLGADVGACMRASVALAAVHRRSQLAGTAERDALLSELKAAISGLGSPAAVKLHSPPDAATAKFAGDTKPRDCEAAPAAAAGPSPMVLVTADTLGLGDSLAVPSGLLDTDTAVALQQPAASRAWDNVQHAVPDVNRSTWEAQVGFGDAGGPSTYWLDVECPIEDEQWVWLPALPPPIAGWTAPRVWLPLYVESPKQPGGFHLSSCTPTIDLDGNLQASSCFTDAATGQLYCRLPAA